MSRLILCFFLLIIFFPLPGKAQQPLFRNFQVKEGLPSSEVHDILQDRQGYMWFATDAGVSRFNGYIFENFTTANGLADNSIIGMHLDKKGRIWFRAFSGRLSYFYGDSIYRIGANSRIDELQKISVMTSMYVDIGDTIWCGLSENEYPYYKISPDFNSILPADKKKIQKGDSTHHISYLCKIDDNGYIYGGSGKHVNKTDSLFIYDRFILKEKIAWHNGLNIETKKFQQFYEKGFLYENEQRSVYKHLLNQIGKQCRVITSYQDRSGNAWIGTFRKGLIFLSKNDLKGQDTLRFFPGYSISSIIQDSEHGLWISTLENGVYYIPSGDVWTYTQHDGLPGNKVLSLMMVNGTQIFVGADNGKIARISNNRIDKSFDLNPESDYLPANIYKIAFAGPKRLVFSAAPSFYINPDTWEMGYIYYDNRSLYLRAFVRDGSGRNWGANYNQAYLIDESMTSAVLKVVTPGKVNLLRVYKDNTLLFGCFNGLWKYDIEKNKFEEFRKHPLLRSRIEDILIMPDGKIWLATRGHGLVLVDKNNVTQIAQKDGLASNICRSMVTDFKSTIWVGTNNGISRIQFNKNQQHNIRNYSQQNDLLYKEIYQLAISDNYIWAGSNQGLLCIGRSELLENKTPPPVFITGTSVENRSIDQENGFRIKYNETSIRFNYLGLSYINPGKLLYMYKLEGLDTSWNFTSNTSVQYTTLPHGNYVFKVYAINNDKQKSSSPATISFTVEAPFWITWWFIILCFIVAAVIITTIFNYRLLAIRRRESEKAAMNKKIAEIELKALRSQMNPHFIFNSINSIQHFILKNHTNEAHKYLSKFAHLIRDVLENSKHETISLEQELKTLQLYIELEALRFNFNFRYEINVEETLSNVNIPPMIIQPYVENAIWHGLMHKGKNGELRVNLYHENGLLKVVIEDNGIGRVKSQEYKQKGQPYHRSLGLSVTRERLEIINHMHNSRVDVKITDKYHDNGIPSGTSVEVFLPIIKSTVYDESRNN